MEKRRWRFVLQLTLAYIQKITCSYEHNPYSLHPYPGSYDEVGNFHYYNQNSGPQHYAASAFPHESSNGFPLADNSIAQSSDHNGAVPWNDPSRRVTLTLRDPEDDNHHGRYNELAGPSQAESCDRDDGPSTEELFFPTNRPFHESILDKVKLPQRHAPEFKYQLKHIIEPTSNEFVVVATKNLKSVLGEPFFVPPVATNSQDLGGNNQVTLFCLGRSEKVNSNFFNIFHLLHSHTSGPSSSKGDSQSQTKEVEWQYLFNFKEATKKKAAPFDSSSIDHRPRKFQVYTLVAQHYFKNEMLKILENIHQYFKDDHPKKFGHLESRFVHTMWLFPIYLIYVDMINVILPVKDLEKPDALRNARTKAGEIYWEVMHNAIFEQASNSANEAQSNLFQDMTKFLQSTKLTMAARTHGNAFLWKIIFYWLMSERPEIIRVKPPIIKLSENFKYFIARMVYSWIHFAKNNEEEEMYGLTLEEYAQSQTNLFRTYFVVKSHPQV